MDNTSILIFKAIVGFISDINSEFGKKEKSIALYNRLLEKTGIVNIGPINKHIDCFRKFFNDNQKGMEEKNQDLFVDSKISYSEKVYVDVAVIIKESSSENKQIIWNHLLTIWGLIDPTSQAKKILHDNLKLGGDGKEEKFLTDIIEKVEKSVSGVDIDQSNPMASIGALMQSGVFTNLITDMQTGLSDGSLDISKLMGSVQGMMSKMGGQGGGMPDLSSMMGMMGPMMSNMMNGNTGNMENKK